MASAQLIRLAYSNDSRLNLENKTRDVWQSAFGSASSNRPAQLDLRVVVEECAQAPLRAAPFIVLETSLSTISSFPGVDPAALHAAAGEALETLLRLAAVDELTPTCCPEAIAAMSPCIRAMGDAIQSHTDNITAACFAALRDGKSAARRAAALDALTALATRASMGHYLSLAVVIAERHAKYDSEEVKSAASAFLAAVEAGGAQERAKEAPRPEASTAESSGVEVELEVPMPPSLERVLALEEEDAASSAPVESMSALCSDLPTLDTTLEEEMERFLRGSIAPLPRTLGLGAAAAPYANLVREAMEGEESSALDVSGIEAILRRCLDLHSEQLYDLHTRNAEATLLQRSQEISDGTELDRLAEALEVEVHRAVAEEHEWFMEHAMPAIADALADTAQQRALVDGAGVL